MPKLAVREANLTPVGLEGDRQRDLRYHGGPERAVCLFSLERIIELQAEGHPIYPGSTGENVTIAGLDWSQLKLGARLAFGEDVLLEISSQAAPCKIIADSFTEREFNRISHKVFPGDSRLYARVLQTGKLFIGQTVRLLDGQSHPAKKN